MTRFQGYSVGLGRFSGTNAVTASRLAPVPGKHVGEAGGLGATEPDNARFDKSPEWPCHSFRRACAGFLAVAL